MINDDEMKNILVDILMERASQDATWGEQNHTIEWMSILGEEYGELCKEMNDFHWGKAQGDYEHSKPNLRYEAVQVAAVALAIIECIDRNG